MSKKYRPMFLSMVALSLSLPAMAQLPPTNMGKFVHQPGDNQYSVNTQGERHGGNYYDTNGGPHVMKGPAQGSAPPPPRYSVAPPPPKGPDVSIEPIPAEEPIAAAGFPPLPMNLDLPVSPSVTAAAGGSWTNKSSGGGGGGGGGGPAQPTGMHQHYGHYEPGAFANRGGGGGGGGGGEAPSDSGAAPDAPKPRNVPATPYTDSGSGGGGGNYYKVRTPPPVMRQESFATTTGGTTGKGAMSAPTNIGSRGGGGGGGLGKAPTLDEGQDATAGAPEAPTATGVFQATSNDLTLPDDEYTSRNFKNGKSGRYVKQMMKRGKSMGRQMMRQSGVPISF